MLDFLPPSPPPSSVIVPPPLDIQHALKMYAILDLSLLISLILPKNTLGNFFILLISMKQLIIIIINSKLYEDTPPCGRRVSTKFLVFHFPLVLI